MPLYEYKCNNCGDIFEMMQKFSDEPLKVHATCGGSVDRLLSAPSFQFKGSGFYITDYGRTGSQKNGKSNSEAPKAESKPAKSDSSEKSGSSKSTTTT